MTSVKKQLRIKKYHYKIMNYELILDECVVYIGENVDEEKFNPASDEHLLPKFEQARALVVLAARQSETIRLTSQDKSEGVVAIYVRACKRELKFGLEQTIKAQVKVILDKLQSI